jgi:predicted transcriptional regulator
MTAEKTVALSFRVSPKFKLLLEEAAARAHRSQTNMLETLVFDYCAQQGIAAYQAESEEKTRGTK